MMELILSAPTTTTFLAVPFSTNWAPVVNANKNPLHAADRSNPQALVAPALWAMRLAVEGKSMSGVTVAQMTMSMSSGANPDLAHKDFTASAPMSDVALLGSLRMRRSWMPVRVRIHSSVVSTIFSRSKLVSLSSGKYPETHVMAAGIGVVFRVGQR